MKTKVLNRRQFLLKELNSSKDLVTIVTETAINFRCSSRTVYRDIEDRAKWIPEILGIDDSGGFFFECLSRYKFLYNLAKKEFDQASGTYKLGYLRCMIQLTDRLFEFCGVSDVKKRLESLESLNK